MAEAQEIIDTRAIEIATEARSVVSAHERTCAERQLAILESFKEAKTERIAFQLTVNKSLDRIEGMQWKAAAGLIAAMGALLLAIIVVVLTVALKIH
jgi:Flp pilus assembly protein TadB